MSVNNEEDFDYLKSQKSYVLSPSFLNMARNDGYIGEYRSNFVPKEERNRSSGTSEGDFPQLKLPLIPEKNAKNFSREEMSLSIASSTDIILSTKVIVYRLLLAIKISSALQILGFSSQAALFGIMAGHTDQNCQLRFALGLLTGVLACLGILFGCWIIFSNFISSHKKCLGTALAGTFIASLHLGLIIVFILYQRVNPLKECVNYSLNFLFQYRGLLIILLATFLCELFSTIFIWRAIYDRERIQRFEQIETSKSILLSQVAKILIQN